ncbi:MAG: hypothetical protein ACRD40_01305 [Candidatus Acidiferrales bacterium]
MEGPLKLAICLAASMLFCSSALAQSNQSPQANPGRPTVSTPATLTPVGYLQFETGGLGATDSPGVSTFEGINEVAKLTVAPRLQLLAAFSPFAHYFANGQTGSSAGGISLGGQAVIRKGEGASPTIALSYFHEVYGGAAPDLDMGSATNSGILLASADVKGFHYDSNALLNEMTDSGVRRAQYGQTLSVSHYVAGKLSVSGEIWHFTQPFLRGNAVGNLWALNYNARNTLVFDAGFDRGLTHTSTQWEAFAGFTYLLPHRLW